MPWVCQRVSTGSYLHFTYPGYFRGLFVEGDREFSDCQADGEEVECFQLLVHGPSSRCLRLYHPRPMLRIVSNDIVQATVLRPLTGEADGEHVPLVAIELAENPDGILEL